MDSSHPIFKSAVERYIKDKGGFEFYGTTVDPARSSIVEDGSIQLRKKRSGEILAQYSLDEIGLTAAEVNACLSMLRDHSAAASIDSDEGIDLSSINLQGLDARMKLGLIASIVLFIGALSPIARLPLIGTINYIKDGRGDGVLIVIIAFLSAFLVVRQKYLLLGNAGRAALVICFASIWHFHFLMAKARSSMSDLGDNPFRGLGEAVIGSFGLEWGWALLLGASLALVVCSRLSVVNGKLVLPSSAYKIDSFSFASIPVQLVVCVLIGLAIGAITAASS